MRCELTNVCTYSSISQTDKELDILSQAVDDFESSWWTKRILRV